MKTALAIVCLLFAFEVLQASELASTGNKYPKQRSILRYFKQMRTKQLKSNPDVAIDSAEDSVANYLNLLAVMASLKDRYFLPPAIARYQTVHF